ncbi:MAG: type II secretion system protein GspL [Gammaproteobacteria bacterium]
MSNPTIIRISSTDPQQIQWLNPDKASSAELQSGSWDQLPQDVHEAILLVPATDISLHTLTLPNINMGKLAQAIPFALEDKLASDIDDLHFVFTRVKSSDEVVVATSSHKQIQTWQQQLQKHSLKVKFILPESLLLPTHNDGCTVLVDGDIAYIQTQNYQNAAIDITALAETIELIFMDDNSKNIAVSADDTQDIRQKIHLYAPSNTKHSHILQDLNYDVENHIVDQPILSLLAQNIGQARSLNLLQGTYKTSYHSPSNIWTIAGALGLALLATVFTAKIIENNYLNKQSNLLATDIKSHYQQVFPQAKTVPTNLRKPVQAKIDELRANISYRPFLSLLSASGDAIFQSPGIRLNSFSFANDVLTINIGSNSANTIDLMTKKLQDNNLNILSNAVSTDSGTTKATVTLTQGDE